MAQPVNDNIENAIVIAGDGFSFTGTTADATLQVGEPAAYDGDPYPENDADDSVWFVYTASATGTIVLETEGFDSSFAYNVFLSTDGSSSFASLQERGSGASFGSGNFYEEINVVAGQTYYIRFAGYGYNDGNYTMIQSSGPAGVAAPLAEIVGTTGNDVLGTPFDGAQSMIGGDGDDAYYVDSTDDVVTETGGGGYDSIYTLVNYTLPANVEKIVALGSTGLLLTGNALDNQLFGAAGADTLVGGDGNDKLDGRGGADSMVGGDGDDSYYVNDAGDVVVELADEGTDTVYTTIDYALSANIEKVIVRGSAGLAVTGNGSDNVMTGGAGADTLSGGAGADRISGGAGADVLIGGADNDVLTGGAGADIFVFAGVDQGRDTITDFQIGVDKIGIDLAAFDLTSFDAGMFESNARGIATTEDARFIYSENNGRLFFDADGSGSGKAVLLATLRGAPELTAADFTDASLLV